jgi:chemotaxis protein CheD
MPQQDVFLNAGEFFFRAADTAPPPDIRVRTLLGSCVSIVLWHPVLGAGMSHSVLPVRSSTQGPLDGNHCEGAVALFLRELRRRGTPPALFQAFLVGGARMSIGVRNGNKASVGERNVDASRTLLLAAGFAIAGEHVGGSGPRRLTMQLQTGRIEVLYDHRVTVLSSGRD